MFIVVDADVLWVCEHRQICSIRSISDGSIGIPWIGSGVLGKASFMLMREVSVSPCMVIFGRELVFILAGALFYGTVMFRKKLGF
jgi:hypothetical protein